jgi:hypothetical protein
MPLQSRGDGEGLGLVVPSAAPYWLGVMDDASALHHLYHCLAYVDLPLT